MTSARALAAGAAVVLALVVPACTTTKKGSNATTTNPPSTISKADYVKKVNAICVQGNKDSQALGKTVDTSKQAEIDKAVKDKLVPLRRTQIASMRALGYPAGDQATLDALYRDTEAVLDIWQKAPGRAGDSSLMSDINARLKAYGLTACAG
jgi:hypothetical protein